VRLTHKDEGGGYGGGCDGMWDWKAER